jgi:hypothetical protein
MGLRGCITKPAGLPLSMSSGHPIIVRLSFISWRKANSRRTSLLNVKESGTNLMEQEAFTKSSNETGLKDDTDFHSFELANEEKMVGILTKMWGKMS